MNNNELQELNNQLSIKSYIVSKHDLEYEYNKNSYMGSFNDILPSNIIFCANSIDVSHAINFVRETGREFRIRSGGSSFGGYNTCNNCTIIDVSLINHIIFDADHDHDHDLYKNVFHIGAGVQTRNIKNYLNNNKYFMPHGFYDLLGISGYGLGGGNGFYARTFGLFCDNIISAEIVTADGNIRLISQNNQSDLFVAIKGSGGGNFGVVTQFTLPAIQMPHFVIGYLEYRWNYNLYPNLFIDIIRLYRNWLSQNDNNQNKIPIEFNIYFIVSPPTDFNVYIPPFLHTKYPSIQFRVLWIGNYSNGLNFLNNFFSVFIDNLSLVPDQYFVKTSNYKQWHEEIAGTGFNSIASVAETSKILFNYSQVNNEFLMKTSEFFIDFYSNYYRGGILTAMQMFLWGGNIINMDDPNSEFSSFPNRDCKLTIGLVDFVVIPFNPLNVKKKK
eukprot:442688_1